RDSHLRRSEKQVRHHDPGVERAHSRERAAGAAAAAAEVKLRGHEAAKLRSEINGGFRLPGGFGSLSYAGSCAFARKNEPTKFLVLRWPQGSAKQRKEVERGGFPRDAEASLP